MTARLLTTTARRVEKASAAPVARSVRENGSYGNSPDWIAQRLRGRARLQQLRRTPGRRRHGAGRRRRARRRDQLLRHRRHLRRHQERGVPRAGARRPPGPGGPRHQVRRSRSTTRARGAKPGVHPPGRRGQPAPAGDRPHRPLPAPPARRRDPHRRHARRLDELVQAGKVREIGCSNFSAEQLREAEAAVQSGRGAVRQRPERIQPAQARPRGRGAPRVRAAGARLPPLSSRSPAAC